MKAPKIPKIIRNKWKSLRTPKVLYFTYVLNFPDGDVWVKQRPFVQELEWEMKEMLKESRHPEWKNRVFALWTAGECWWKDNLDVEHLILIEDKKRREKWGVSKEGLATIETGVNLHKETT